MLLTVLHAAMVVLVALVMGASFSHVLEMPPKMAASGQFWVNCQHILYRYYRFVAGPAEIAALLITAGFVYFGLGRSGSYATVIAVISLIFALILWMMMTEPANRQIAKWNPERLPADWARWRTRWEYSHLIRFALHLVALVSLLVRLLMQVRQE